VALAADALLTPEGRVNAALFYPDDVESQVITRLGVYLAAGYDVATAITPALDEATADKLASTYAYWRAWDDVAQRLVLGASSATLEGEGTITRLGSQISEWLLQRDKWQADYLALIPDTSGSTTRTAGTRALTNQYHY
jgi:hypothetical protein